MRKYTVPMLLIILMTPQVAKASYQPGLQDFALLVGIPGGIVFWGITSPVTVHLLRKSSTKKKLAVHCAVFAAGMIIGNMIFLSWIGYN